MSDIDVFDSERRVTYDATGVFTSTGGITRADVAELQPMLLAARQAVLDDVALVRSRAPIPRQLEPLDADFVRLPADLLDGFRTDGATSEVARIIATADTFRNRVDRFVVVGIGGSYMGTRSLFEALCRPYFNEHSRADRGDRPRVYFEGHNVDSDPLSDLISLLNGSRTETRWGIIVVSKSGRTLEPALVFRRLLLELERQPKRAEPLPNLVIPVTGPDSALREVAAAIGCKDIFDIPTRLGGRYSVLSAAGLLPAAVLGIDIVGLLAGAVAMTRRFEESPAGDNPVLDYVAVSHLMETRRGAHCRILSVWGRQLEALGLWHDQLLSESLGKEGHGATPITIVNTRDLHSRGQQHQQGARDKMITNVIVETPRAEPELVGGGLTSADELDDLAQWSFHQVLSAAVQGVNAAYRSDGRPTADLRLPELNAYCVGQLLQMLMLATAVEGRLIGVNPYGQPGVEAYKREMAKLLGRKASGPDR